MPKTWLKRCQNNIWLKLWTNRLTALNYIDIQAAHRTRLRGQVHCINSHEICEEGASRCLVVELALHQKFTDPTAPLSTLSVWLTGNLGHVPVPIANVPSWASSSQCFAHVSFVTVPSVWTVNHGVDLGDINTRARRIYGYAMLFEGIYAVQAAVLISTPGGEWVIAGCCMTSVCSGIEMKVGACVRSRCRLENQL